MMVRAIAAALMWAVCGCGASSDTPQHEGDAPAASKPADDNVPSPTQLCAARCERRATCRNAESGGAESGSSGGSAESSSDCMSRCVKNLPDTHAVRPGLLWRMLGCIDAMECVFVEQGRAWDACFESGRAGLPITKPLRRFCFESSRRAAKCGRAGEADQTACLTRFRHIRDEQLEAATECTRLACDQVSQCFGSKLGF